jgi:chemotaxis protein CheD
MSAPAGDGERHPVRIGELKVGRGGSILFTLGLGSCVAVALYDARSRVGGLAHVMLPTAADARPGAPPGRFAATAVTGLLAMMVEAGVAAVDVRARIAGGASMIATVLPDGGRALGRRNVEAVRAALDVASIPIDAEDVGGDHGRSVFLHTADGRLRIRSVKCGDVLL